MYLQNAKRTDTLGSTCVTQDTTLLNKTVNKLLNILWATLYQLNLATLLQLRELLHIVILRNEIYLMFHIFLAVKIFVN